MAQYCRYCSNFITGNGNWCDAKDFEPTDSYAKHTNDCKFFELNPVDAFQENDKGYIPTERNPKQYDGQMKMELIAKESEAE